jgi:ankyrin repeat protein
MLTRTLIGGLVLVLNIAAVAGDNTIVAAAPGDTRLADAAQRGDLAVVRSLIKTANINSAQGDGMTALHWAAYHNDPEMAKALVQAGANAMAVTRLQRLTPLFLAAKGGYAGVLEVLIGAGADVNAANSTGSTPLMLAAASGNTDAVKLLLDRGANVNVEESTWGETPLIFAAAFNRSEVVKMLLAHGADASVATRVERLDSNKEYDPDAVNERPTGAKAESTEEGTADPTKVAARQKAAEKRAAASKMRSAEAMGGMTALHFAARGGHLDTIRSLVDAGANVNLLSAADQTSPLL